jgi:hypothetical protein
MLRYLSRSWTGPGPHFLFAVIMLAIFGATLFTGIVPTRSHPYDVVFFADAGWRTLSGLRPHLDYYSPYGDGVQLLLAAGQWLAGGSVEGVGYISGCVGVVVGVWAYLLLLRRTSSLFAVVTAASLALLSVATVSLGYSFALASQAMFYNRFAFAFLGLVIIEAFPLSSDPKFTTAGAFSTGVASALLLFLKASYFAVAVVLAAASLLWTTPIQLRRLVFLAVGFVAGALPFLVYLRFRVDLLYGDIHMAGASRTAPLKLSALMNFFTQDILQLVILLALAFLLGYEYGSPSVIRRWRIALLAFTLYIAGVLLMSTNAQPSRLPLDELLALLLAGAFLEIATRATSRIQPAVAAALAVIALGLALPNIATDAAALANGMRLKRSYNRDYAHNIPIAGMEPWIIVDDYIAPEATINTGAFLAPYLTDGVELLRANLKPGERVATMDAYNPFPFLLGIPPPTGGMAAAAYHIVFDERNHPDANVYFGNADVVMYPQHAALNEEMFAGLPKIYGAALEQRFQMVAESAGWKLYRRRP